MHPKKPTTRRFVIACILCGLPYLVGEWFALNPTCIPWRDWVIILGNLLSKGSLAMFTGVIFWSAKEWFDRRTKRASIAEAQLHFFEKTFHEFNHFVHQHTNVTFDELKKQPPNFLVEKTGDEINSILYNRIQTKVRLGNAPPPVFDHFFGFTVGQLFYRLGRQVEIIDPRVASFSIPFTERFFRLKEAVFYFRGAIPTVQDYGVLWLALNTVQTELKLLKEIYTKEHQA